MKKVVSDEGARRELKGKVGFIVGVIAVIWSLFQLVVAVYPISTNTLRAIHLSFGLALGLIIFPLKRVQDKSDQRKVLFVDVILALISILPGIYICLFQQDVMMRMGEVTPIERILGIIIIALLIDFSRRVMGWSVTIVAIIAIIYAFFGFLIPGPLGHKGFSLDRIISQLYLTNEGIYTIPIGVSAAFVYLFMLFGTFLQYSGGGDFFLNIASAGFGKLRGGPAKIAVISSGLFGMISGSAVSNVMVDGWLTIPLMQKVGFRAQLAAAIEAVASTGGQLMPPIMGAAAFIIPDMIGKTYLNVILAAAIPGILYYMALFFMVDFEAANLGLKGLSQEELPSFKKTMKEGYPFIIPIAVLIYSIGIIGTSPTIAGFWATLSVLGATLLRKSTRMDLKKIIKALETAAYGAVVVVSACALGGILIGIVMMTGLGMNLSTIIVDLSGGNTVFLLLLTMITSLILGMGMTTTACYIILAILVGPALIKMGVSPMGAHLFIFYFGIISCITPPVALAAYAAAGLGNTDPMKTGYTAFRIGVTGFIIPFMFIYRPALILEGSFLMIITSFLATSLGVYALCAATQGYLLGKLILIKRVILFIAALLLIVPGFITDAIGLFLVLIIFFPQMYQRSKRKNQPY